MLQTFTIPARPEGYETALKRAQDYTSVNWGLEGTGFYGQNFARVLRRAGHTVYEVPGAATQRQRRRGPHRGKSDPIDARSIAEVVLRDAQSLPLYEHAVTQETLRLRYDQRDRLVKERSKAINRLRGAALRLGLLDLPRNLSLDSAVKRVLGSLENCADSAARSALRDEVVFAAEDIMLANRRISRITKELKSTVLRVGHDLLGV